MAADFTTIFGNDINVYAQPRQAFRQYAGFSGAHGVTSMYMGTRGRQLVITGRLASSGASYNAARSNCQSVINSIEAYLWAEPADYRFKGTTYNDVVFDKFQLVPDSAGSVFHWTAEGYVIANFICFLRSLL